MAGSKTAVAAFFLVALVVAAASLPAASADACTDDCYKLCSTAGKDDPACTSSCDEKCRIKAAAKEYDAAAPAEKKAVAGELRTQSDGGVAATVTDKKAADLATSCVDECYGRCGPEKSRACTSRCDMVCRTEVESLAFAADMYIAATPAQKAIVISAVDKQAEEPEGKINALSAKCISECTKFCNNPNCVAVCNDGCYAKAVSVAFAIASPLKKDAIYREIDNAQDKKDGAA